MDGEGHVSLKEHFEALREADLRAVELVREWTKERLESHNNLLTKWQESTAADRSRFASAESLNALTKSFDVYKEITARALALAEGKSSGFDAVRIGASFVAGVILAAVAVWGALHGLK